MVRVQAVTGAPMVLAAQTLMREYGHFLRQTQSCGSFDHDRFQHEVDAMPWPYAEHGGEVLLGFVPGAGACDPDEAAGGIAYRGHTLDTSGETAEIKRLYVRAAYRGQGVARALVAEALRQARLRQFQRIVLDTDLATMPGARELYESFGFREFGERQGTIALFQLDFTAETRA